MGKSFEKRAPSSGSNEELQSHEEEKNLSLPNSFVMRIMQQSDAEAEADRLSEGVTSTSPAALKREMGERLGAGGLPGLCPAGYPYGTGQQANRHVQNRNTYQTIQITDQKHQ